jgi:hypothetical protein
MGRNRRQRSRLKQQQSSARASDADSNPAELWTPPADVLAVDDHVRSCERCRALASALLTGESALVSLKKSTDAGGRRAQHPKRAVLHAFIRRELDEVDDELTSTHIELCERCREQVKRLLLNSETGSSHFASSCFRQFSNERPHPPVERNFTGFEEQ